MNPRQRFAILDVCLRSRFQQTEEQASQDGSATMPSSQHQANANRGRGPHQGVQPLVESRSPFERPRFLCAMGPWGELLL